MKGLDAFLRKEALEFARTHRMFVSFVSIVLIGLVSPLIAKLTPLLLKSLASAGDGFSIMATREPNIGDAIMQFSKNFALLPILILLLSMAAVSGERRRKSSEVVFSKPVSAGACILAKFLVPLLIYVVSLVVAWGCFLVYCSVLFEGNLPRMENGVLLLMVVLAFYQALGVFLSAMFNAPAAAAGAGIVVFTFLSVLGSFGAAARATPAGVLPYAHTLMSGGEARWAWNSALSAIAFIVLFLALATWSLDRRKS